MRASVSNNKHPTRSLLPMLRTPTWGETWRFEELAGDCEEACLIEIGTSDIGRPIHAFIMARAGMTSEFGGSSHHPARGQTWVVD